MSTLVGHFVSSPREREKRDRRDSRRDEREEQGRKRPLIQKLSMIGHGLVQYYFPLLNITITKYWLLQKGCLCLAHIINSANHRPSIL